MYVLYANSPTLNHVDRLIATKTNQNVATSTKPSRHIKRALAGKDAKSQPKVTYQASTASSSASLSKASRKRKLRDSISGDELTTAPSQEVIYVRPLKEQKTSVGGRSGSKDEPQKPPLASEMAVGSLPIKFGPPGKGRIRASAKVVEYIHGMTPKTINSRVTTSPSNGSPTPASNGPHQSMRESVPTLSPESKKAVETDQVVKVISGADDPPAPVLGFDGYWDKIGEEADGEGGGTAMGDESAGILAPSPAHIQDCSLNSFHTVKDDFGSSAVLHLGAHLKVSVNNGV